MASWMSCQGPEWLIIGLDNCSHASHQLGSSVFVMVKWRRRISKVSQTRLRQAGERLGQLTASNAQPPTHPVQQEERLRRASGISSAR